MNTSDLHEFYDDENLVNLITAIANDPMNRDTNGRSMTPEDQKTFSELQPSLFDEAILDFPDLLTFGSQINSDSIASGANNIISPIGSIPEVTILPTETQEEAPKDILEQILLDTLSPNDTSSLYSSYDATGFNANPGQPRTNSSRTISRSSDEGIGMMSPFNSDSNGSTTTEIQQDIIDDSASMPDSSILMGFNSEAQSQTKHKLGGEDQDSGICKVCKEKAGKHSYYGGRVCPSCRAFFRRAVQSKYYEIFFCTKGEKCDINLKTRRSCQYCRFKKCLEAGMRIAWVLPDGERNRRFNKLQKQSTRNKVAESTLVPIRRGPTLSVSNEDLAQINQVHDILCKSGGKIFWDYMRSKPSFVKNLANITYFGGLMPHTFFEDFTTMSDRITHELYKAMDEFGQLSFSDRKRLVETNKPLINAFKRSVVIHEDLSCVSHGIESARKSGEFPGFDEVTKKMEEMNISNRRPVFAYNQFFPSPWAASYEDEERHFELTKLMKAWPRDNSDSPIDDILMTLMKLIIAFSPDFADLERRDLVERVQLRYTYLLQKYLKFRFGDDANNRFFRGLMVVSYAREAVEIFNRRPTTQV